MKLHQVGTIHNLYQQPFEVVLDLDATGDGHLSGFVNFQGENLRPDGFPVGQKFSIITDDPRGDVVQEFMHLTIKFVSERTAQVTGHIHGSRAQFQNVNTVANVQAELDDRFAQMAIEEAQRSTPEDTQPRPKVGAVAVKHGQLLGKDCRTAVMSNGKMNGQHAEFRLSTRLSGAELDGCTIYTTLEPCLNRGDPKVSCVDRLISSKVARVVIGALDPDPRGNGLRKLTHSPTIEVALFPAHLRADARLLIQEWKDYSEKQQKKVVTNPERDALRERILEQKGKEVLWLNKKSDSHGRGIIVDCDEEVAILRCGTSEPFTYSLSELETSKQFGNGQMHFALVFKDR
ncbi:MAG TPA: deaminase [Terriglobales bacterium]|nr:deaminase [Terriglobales bacterium]